MTLAAELLERLIAPEGYEVAVAPPGVVVRRTGDEWQVWACRHPLADGDDEADRVTSVYFVSSDALEWTAVGIALAPTPGTWDARCAT